MSRRLERNLNKKQKTAMRQKVMSARAKLERKLGRPLILDKKCGKSVTGGSDLALSSAYTTSFSVAVFKTWFREWALARSEIVSEAD